MYDIKNLTYLLTILECIEKCWIYSNDYDNPKDFIFADEQKSFNATLTMFVSIGEEIKKCDESLKKAVKSGINFKDVAGLRDKISHNYRGIDADILWAVIKKDLVKLKEAVIDMIKLINPPKELIEASLNSPYYKHIKYLKEILY
jgi:uncharacterized protein with HEPN domain